MLPPTKMRMFFFPPYCIGRREVSGINEIVFSRKKNNKNVLLFSSYTYLSILENAGTFYTVVIISRLSGQSMDTHGAGSSEMVKGRLRAGILHYDIVNRGNTNR